ncbi:MAG: fused signal recognition particle receptor [Chloroflexi bacterium]|nr:MAG: fused signal recognition particle receptor [Chloroflexota bacterium]
MKFFHRNERTKQTTEKALRRTKDAWFKPLTRIFLNNRFDDAAWNTLEEALISSDIGVTTAMDIIERLKTQFKSSHDNSPFLSVKNELNRLLENPNGPIETVLGDNLSGPKPLVILMVGVNGGGKTTSVAKLANMYKQLGKKVLLGGADTFRAAAAEQLQVWADRLDVDLVSNETGGDPGAIAFDSIRAGISRKADVVIIDTAGRLHTKNNLMDELSKINKILDRDEFSCPRATILVLDATTGQNGLSQAEYFSTSIHCDGIFLAKLDGSAKGGFVFGIKEKLNLPIMFVGTGENVEDMSVFEPKTFVEALLS